MLVMDFDKRAVGTVSKIIERTELVEVGAIHRRTEEIPPFTDEVGIIQERHPAFVQVNSGFENIRRLADNAEI